jgi:hypothetical protein
MFVLFLFFYICVAAQQNTHNFAYTLHVFNTDDRQLLMNEAIKHYFEVTHVQINPHAFSIANIGNDIQVGLNWINSLNVTSRAVVIDNTHSLINQTKPLKSDVHVLRRINASELSTSTAQQREICHFGYESYFNINQVACMYDFPHNAPTRVNIAIIELGGGYYESDLVQMWKSLGLSGTPTVRSISVDGASNSPGPTTGLRVVDFEVALDVQLIGGLFSNGNVNIDVYFAWNSDASFYNAISKAVYSNANYSSISISWGRAENQWSSRVMNAFERLFTIASEFGITVFAASGDDGSADGESGINVNFPASAPHAIACGGTSLTLSSEVAWSYSGGGLSSVFSAPDWQKGIGKKRSVPDVSGDADPNTGYLIFFGGDTWITAGTSAVAPLWAALWAQITHERTFASPFLYNLYSNKNNYTTAFRDITSGTNGAYSASSGYDLVTGLGSPRGDGLLGLLSPKAIITTPPVTQLPQPSTGEQQILLNILIIVLLIVVF